MPVSLNEFQRSTLGGDIIEDQGDIIYVGLLKSMTDETMENNCLIKRIERTVDPQTGYVTIRTKYANGEDCDMKYTWADREKYNYEYPRSK